MAEPALQKTLTRNALTGGDNPHEQLYPQLRESLTKATSIDLIVSFLMESGVWLILQDLQSAIQRGAKIRILTGNYLGITEPSALALLKQTLGDQIDLRFYSDPDRTRSFHPKAYLFHYDNDDELFIGSSNISQSALTAGIEWNYRLRRSQDPEGYQTFLNTYQNLFDHHAIRITDQVLESYSASWHKPSLSKDLQKLSFSVAEPKPAYTIYRPRGAQIEALYALKRTRNEGATKALVVAATGIGKTYLAAFDSQPYKRVLFVAHRQEILKQAAESFSNVRGSNDYGFFLGEQKDTQNSMIFASVASLGKKAYLNPSYFAPDAFPYIVIDEFHHAVNEQYRLILDYFKPKFLLGLTATPERMDARNIYEICDYNVPYELDLPDAINKGMLVPFHYYGIYDETSYDGLKIVHGHYQEKDLDGLYLGNQKRIDLIWKHYQKYPSRRALGFCSSRKHAEEMAREFNRKGCPSAAVYSDAHSPYAKERSQALQELKNGTLRVLFSVDMFNEGVDVPSVDMVMFLRPTESPVIFLQQLGRGLRTSPDKRYCNVLDFIGNYQKAGMTPLLLSGTKNITRKPTESQTLNSITYPDDCLVDFDMRLIDLFEQMAQQRKKSIKLLIQDEYERIKQQIKHVPSRVELFTYMQDEIYEACQSHHRINPFQHYLDFLHDLKELTPQEERLYQSKGREFLQLLETTSMTKVYKMPVLMAFLDKDQTIRSAITNQQALETWIAFFSQNGNWKDLHEDLTYKDFQTIPDNEHLKKIKTMPVHYLLQSGNGFFIQKPGYLLALNEELNRTPELARHMRDIITYRTLTYYRNRYSTKTTNKEPAILLFEKTVDKSLLRQGFTVPKAVTDKLFQTLQIELHPGESHLVNFRYKGTVYPVTLTSDNFDRQKYPDHAPIVQFRYNPSDPFPTALRKDYEANKETKPIIQLIYLTNEQVIEVREK